MVDNAILAKKLAAIRDAVERIRATLPATVEDFRSNRTAREVVVLNLYVALQDAIAVATHWVADAGWNVPQTYGEVFATLAEREVVAADLARRLRAAAGLRNLIAHQYGALDFDRVFEFASSDVDDLVLFCQQLAQQAGVK